MSTRILLRFGALAAPLFLGVLLIDGATRPGFSLWRNGASQLGTGERGWLEALNFVVCGLLVLGFAMGVRRVLGSGRGSTWGPILIGAAGVGLVVAGLVPTDPALGYPPGLPATISAAGRVHSLAGMALFFGIPAACFVMARRFGAASGGRRWAWYSIVTGLVVIASATASGIMFRMDVNGLLSPAPAGLLEDVALVIEFTWIAFLALRLLGTRGIRGRQGAQLPVS